MNKRFSRTFIKAMSCALLVSTVISTNVFAKATDIAVRDKDTNKVEIYNLDDLANSLMGDDGKVLFNEFNKKTKTKLAYVDDKNGLVDYGYLAEQLMELGSKKFKINEVTQSAPKANILDLKDEMKRKKVGANGKVEDGDVFKPGTTTAVSAVVQDVDSTSLMGVSIIVVKLNGVDDPSKYKVTIKGLTMTYYPADKVFKVKSEVIYQKSQLSEKDITFQLIGNEQSDEFDVIDIN